ncbi:hypothetical protein NYO99_07335 [Pelomonas sp. UHG3]|uniref:Uncharacterized protein n=1 Tax=Roseateles hydrophilus TaxID=2975054 RepID=A0ACC6C8L7_9BURK|nr:hypothetical protein [Pelomonas sp. UHG3]MCY4744778.1 hypothetical protein [Pelomonas sp. UHG3]
MTRLGVHKRWNKKFLLKEVECRVPEQIDWTPDRLAESLAGHARNENKIAAYAAGDPDFELGDAVFPLQWHAQLLMRRVEFDIYKRESADRIEFALAAWHNVVRHLMLFGRGAALLGTAPCWGSSIRDLAESLAMAYALGWNAAADKIAQCAVLVMPQGALWSAGDLDPRNEARREPFARFTLALYADFAGITLPELPPHPYESPAYDALFACWRDPDPEVLIEPLLATCDWHTHECMYSRSDRPSKDVDFINDTLMGWPVEVHMVYRLRERLGLRLPAELDHPLMKSPLGAYLPPQPVPQDERLNKVIRRACAEVPGLADVLAGVI